MNRREFLAGMAAVLAAGCGSSSISDNTAVAPVDSLAELARFLKGPLLRPGSYGTLTQPYNLRYAGIQPAAVARCADAADMATCLAWAQTHGAPFVVRSGGHSYAGFSQTNGLQIDVSSLTEVRAENGLVHVGAGARNETVEAGLRAPRVAFPHGRCPTVGVSGLVLGGGIGFDMRTHGLTCDHLLETEVLLASGERVVCNEREHPDLFWACRGGGGGNFGINTRFVFSSYPVDQVTVFQLTWTTDPRAVFQRLLSVLDSAPNRLGVKVSVVTTPDQPLTVDLLGQLFGSPEELAALLAPVGPPTTQRVQVLDYWDGQDFLADMEPPEYFQERSRYFFEPLSAAAQAAIFDYLERWPGTSVSAQWKFFLTGGQIDTVSPSATAYVHRGARGLSSVDLNWSPQDRPETVQVNLAWLAQFHEAMAPFTSRQCYQNFIDPDQPDFLRAYYGANLERLVAVKQKYDPGNVFRYAQGIPVVLTPGNR